MEILICTEENICRTEFPASHGYRITSRHHSCVPRLFYPYVCSTPAWTCLRLLGRCLEFHQMVHQRLHDRSQRLQWTSEWLPETVRTRHHSSFTKDFYMKVVNISRDSTILDISVVWTGPVVICLVSIILSSDSCQARSYHRWRHWERS